MKRLPILLPLLLALFFLIIIFVLISPAPPLSNPESPSLPPSTSPPDHHSPPSLSPLASQLNAPTNSPERDLEILHGLLREFTEIVKEPNRPPMGLNEDVVKALTGRNRMQLATIPLNHPAINNSGHLIDRWGTAYFIHPESADAFEVRSAGPDKILFTPDDITR